MMYKNNTNKNDYMYTYALSPSQAKVEPKRHDAIQNEVKWNVNSWKENRESYNNFI